jgi:polyisoprenyl-phosphate glycosyltransferase
MHVSAVIPCYNEEECLKQLYDRMTAACLAAVGDSYEIILVNDGSRDQTWPMIASLAAVDPHIVGVDLARNHGHQLALTAGLSIARGDAIFVVDADLQDPPELLGPMLEIMATQQADVVYGQRTARSGETAFKKASASLFYRLLNSLSDVTIPVDTGDFRLMSKRAKDMLQSMPERHRFVRGMVAWIGFKQVALPYQRDARFAGETKYPLSKMLKLTVDALTGFSTSPLRLASHLGIWFGLAGLFMLLYVIVAWASGSTVSGWASISALVIIIGSLQMILIGIIGEYLGRLYTESKGRPLFIIRDIISAQKPPQTAIETLPQRANTK